MAQEKFDEKFKKFLNEKYIPLNKNAKIGIAAALIVGPVALFVFLFYNPKQAKISELTIKKDQLVGKVTEAEAASKNKERHENELKDAEQKFEEMSVILPKDQEIPSLLRNISDLGKRAGLDFVEFKPGNESPKDFYAEIPISISIKGPYHNVGYFLGEVSGLDRLVTVDNINMGGPQDVAGEILLNSSCNLLTYRFTGKAAAPPPASGGPKKKK